ncbi:MAG: TRAP transporter substrate-binding protein DctP [Rhizobiaceae bacterium]|nr:TRAP transporter substrate-binding protein DctP [Rhizobiaceae bacterium]
MLRKIVLLVSISLLAMSPARADLVADWLAGNAKTSTPVATTTGAPMELKFGHPAPPVSLAIGPWQAAIMNVNKATGGLLAFKEFGAGTLIGPRDGFKAVRGGVAEWATCYVSYEGRGFEMTRVFEQPFVALANPQATARIAQELAPKYFAPEFERAGVVYSTMGSFRPTDIMSKTPIRKWEDLAGLKVVAQGFPPAVATAMGITLVNIPYPEVYVAMQQGTADAVIWVDAGFIPYKVFEVAKYHTTTALTGGGITHCYNRDWFAGLAPDVQASFYAHQEPLGQALAKITGNDFHINAAKTYADNGVEMITLAPEEMARWREKLQPVVAQWIEDNEKEGRPARQLIADIEELAKKYGSMSPDELMGLALNEPVQGIK